MNVYALNGVSLTPWATNQVPNAPYSPNLEQKLFCLSRTRIALALMPSIIVYDSGWRVTYRSLNPEQGAGALHFHPSQDWELLLHFSTNHVVGDLTTEQGHDHSCNPR